MSERSFPFSQGQGAHVTQDDWSAMAGTWQDSGVHDYPAGSALTVVPGPTQNTIQINAGSANIEGFHYDLTVPKIMNVLGNPSGSNRVDLVYLTLDTTTDPTQPQVIPQIATSATILSLGADSIPLAEWTQLPDSVATSTNWGSAEDKRWFAGRRVRPALDGVFPPAEIGGLIYSAADISNQGKLYVGQDISGTPTWVPWYTGAFKAPRFSGFYYSVDAQEPIASIGPTAGHMYVAPFPVSEPESFNRLATRLSNGGSVAGTIRWGIYDDPDFAGFPQSLLFEATSSGAMSLGTTTGIVQNPSTGTGSINWALQPGLYWLCIKMETVGTNQALECLTGPDRHGIMPQLSSSTIASNTSPIAWLSTGNATGALPSTFPSSVGTSGVFPKMALKKV